MNGTDYHNFLSHYRPPPLTKNSGAIFQGVAKL